MGTRARNASVSIPRYFKFSQTPTSVSAGKYIYIYIFYKITRRKLKCGNAPFLSKRKFFIPFMMTCAVAYHGVNFPCFLYSFSKNLLVYYCKCCNLIGYATRYLFVNRYRVAASNTTRPSFSQKIMIIPRFSK